MEDIAPLLGILLYWRLLLVLLGCLGAALLASAVLPSIADEAILTAFVVGIGAGVAWEVAALRRRFPESQAPSESASSRIVALLGFALMGGLVGLGADSSLHAILFALAFTAAVPLTLGPLLGLLSAKRPHFGLLALTAGAMWAGFGIAQWIRKLGVAL